MNYDENPELNITPLVDIMLVLLAILMVAMPAIIYEEKITVPDGTKSTQKNTQQKNLTVRIDLEKNVYIDQDKFALNQFADRLVLLSSKYPSNIPATIKADEKLLYADIMYAMKVLKNANYSIALETK